MIYNISRTSDWFAEKRPCDGAYLHKSGKLELGEVNEWNIAINTLQDLQNLIADVGRVIIDEENIEIYDDYRE
jgi:hypothetical protein